MFIRFRSLHLTVLAVIVVAAGADAQPAPEPIRYVLRFPAPHTHYVEVEARLPTAGQARLDVMMPIWTPGSYLAREYARHVEGIGARIENGKPLTVRKTRKNRWQIDAGGARTIVLSYRVYSREMSVRTNWVEADFAMLNGAPTFITLVEKTRRPHDVRLELPEGWKTSVSPMSAAPDGGAHSYRAEDYDTLVDSPIVAGNPALYTFEVGGKPHVLVNAGEGGVWDGPRSARDVELIVRAAERLWGSLPYPRYVFFNMITESGGGLEHKNSTVMMTSRWRTRTRQGYLDWLGLVGHEYFHAWNVKRLRPVELGPFDYENEVYTTGLWESEGFTSYYGDLLVHRAGLSTRDEYLSLLSDEIQALQSTPGRLVQSAEAASFDAWIKQYRPDENSPNTSISYYTKGMVLGFLLDAKIRRMTTGAQGLDDAMKLAFTKYAGERGFTSPEFRKTMSEVADTDLDGWFKTALETTEELDYTEALEWFGLRFAKAPDRADRGWLGLVTRNEGGRLLVTQVRRETPGYDAGINVGDEILALGDYRVTPDQWNGRMDQYKPGEKATLLVARRERLTPLTVTFGQEPARTWRLELDPNATQEQVTRRRAWLWETSSQTK